MPKEFRLHAPFEPAGDQPTAIRDLLQSVTQRTTRQTLLGVTGSGKSLGFHEPVFLYRKATRGMVPLPPIAIGDFVDRHLQQRAQRVVREEDTEILPLTEEVYAMSINPKTLRSEYRRVTHVTRHRTPRMIYRVRTSRGREVLVTGNHNFHVLRKGVCADPNDRTVQHRLPCTSNKKRPTSNRM